MTAAGATLAALLSDLDRLFPGFRFRVVDEQDRIRSTILFYMNGEIVRSLSQTLSPLGEVHIVAALSGG